MSDPVLGVGPLSGTYFHVPANPDTKLPAECWWFKLPWDFGKIRQTFIPALKPGTVAHMSKKITQIQNSCSASRLTRLWRLMWLATRIGLPPLWRVMLKVFSDVLITLSELCYFYNYTFSASFLSLTQAEGELLLSLSQEYPPPPGEGDVLNFCKENYLVCFTEMIFSCMFKLFRLSLKKAPLVTISLTRLLRNWLTHILKKKTNIKAIRHFISWLFWFFFENWTPPLDNGKEKHIYREHRAIFETCDLWDIYSSRKGDKTWPPKRQWQRQRQQKLQQQWQTQS